MHIVLGWLRMSRRQSEREQNDSAVVFALKATAHRQLRRHSSTACDTAVKYESRVTVSSRMRSGLVWYIEATCSTETALNRTTATDAHPLAVWESYRLVPSGKCT